MRLRAQLLVSRKIGKVGSGTDMDGLRVNQEVTAQVATNWNLFPSLKEVNWPTVKAS